MLSRRLIRLKITTGRAACEKPLRRPKVRAPGRGADPGAVASLVSG